MDKQPNIPNLDRYMSTMHEHINKLLATETFTQDQRSIAIQLALMIHSHTMIMAGGSYALSIQSKVDQEKIIMTAFKICTAAFEMAIEFGVG